MSTRIQSRGGSYLLNKNENQRTNKRKVNEQKDIILESIKCRVKEA